MILPTLIVYVVGAGIDCIWRHFPHGEALLDCMAEEAAKLYTKSSNDTVFTDDIVAVGRNNMMMQTAGEKIAGPNLVFVDQHMGAGRMLGTDVIQVLRSRGYSKCLIGLSGNDITPLFQESGADAAFVKPLKKTDCVDIVQRFVLFQHG